jgi:hypothetical protein
MTETHMRQRRTLAGAGTDVRRCSDALGPRKDTSIYEREIMTRVRLYPLELCDCKPEPSERLLLAASAIVMDDLDQFPDYRLDTLHFDRTTATARLQSENLLGCTSTLYLA